MDILDIFDIIIALVIIVNILLAWEIYQIGKDKSMLWLFAGISLGLVTRFLIYFNVVAITARITALVFWVLWAIALYFFLKLLNKYIKRTRETGLINKIKRFFWSR